MEPMKNSGLGIASFITSILSGILIFILIVVAGIMETSTPGGINEQSPQAIIVGLFILAFSFLCLVALGLGIAGLIQKNRKKLFAVLGTVFSTVTILGVIGLMILGSTMG